MSDRVLIPLPGIGTLSLTRAQYDAALIPIAPPEVPKPIQARHPESPQVNAPAKPPGLRYLRLRDVRERVGVGSSTIYKMMSSGVFPKQVKLSERTSVWIESEVEDFMNACIAERSQPPPPSEKSLYCRMRDAMRLTGLTPAMIYDGVRARTFPKWANLPKRGSGWLKTDIEEWLAARDKFDT
jgi:prophage regulatory protein